MGFEVGGSASQGRWWCHSTAGGGSRSIFEELRIISWKNNCARGVHPFCLGLKLFWEQNECVWDVLRYFANYSTLEYKFVLRSFRATVNASLFEIIWGLGSTSLIIHDGYMRPVCLFLNGGRLTVYNDVINLSQNTRLNIPETQSVAHVERLHLTSSQSEETVHVDQLSV